MTEQPFTWADVDALIAAADLIMDAHREGTFDATAAERAQTLDSIADRIAALLPPR